MKRILLSILPIAVMAVLGACSTATAPIENCTLENNFALQTGNWWVYDAYNTDFSNTMISGTERQDSTVVERTDIYNGKTAYMLVTYSTVDGGVTYTVRDTVWIAMDNGQASMPMHNLTPNHCPCFADEWVRFADCSAENWTAFETTRTDTLPALISVSGKDSIVMTQSQTHYQTQVNREESSTMVIDGQTVATQTFHVVHRVESVLLEPVDVTYLIGSRTMTGVEDIRFVLGENIGIVTMERTAQQLLEATTTYYNDKQGVVKHLLRYSVK